MSSGVGLRSERGPVLIAIMISTALVALDSTIIATAVPSIVRSVGGFNEFPWLFSIYLLAQAVSVPVYGKVADLFGRKPVILFGIGVFLVGSILCGLAWSMLALIVARIVQGLGAGAIQPMAITIAGDLYSLEERAKVQGYIASVWGMSAVVGPAIGGVFSEYVGWRWVFLINIPLCLLACAMLIRNFHERVERSRTNIDYAGAALVTTACSLLILGALEGGQAWAWTSATSIAVLLSGAALVVVFVLVEQRVAEPIIPPWVYRSRLLVTSSLVSACVGGVLIGLSSFVPTFVQDVLGTGPVVAGFALAALTLGWPIAASQAGRIYLRIGFRSCALIGCASAVTGCVLLLLLGPSSSVLQVGFTCFFIGLGMGLVSSPTLIAAQSSARWNQRGVVTGNNLFNRSLGSAFGAAALGAIANATLGSGGIGTGSTAGGHTPAALDTAVHHVFIGVVVITVLMTLAVLAMARDRARAVAPEASLESDVDPPSAEASIA